MKLFLGLISVFFLSVILCNGTSMGQFKHEINPATEKPLGWLFMNGRMYDSSVEITTEGERVWVGEDIFIRGTVVSHVSEGKLLSDDFSRIDIYSLAAESVWNAIQNNQAITDSLVLTMEEWVNEHLNLIDYPEVNVEIDPQNEWMIFTSGNPPVRMVSKIEPRGSESKPADNSLLVNEVRICLDNGAGVAWGEDYILIFSPEEADHVLTVLEELIENKDLCSSQDFQKYGLFEVDGVKLLNSFVYDLCIGGEK